MYKLINSMKDNNKNAMQLINNGKNTIQVMLYNISLCIKFVYLKIDYLICNDFTMCLINICFSVWRHSVVANPAI